MSPGASGSLQRASGGVVGQQGFHIWPGRTERRGRAEGAGSLDSTSVRATKLKARGGRGLGGGAQAGVRAVQGRAGLQGAEYRVSWGRPRTEGLSPNASPGPARHHGEGAAVGAVRPASGSVGRAGGSEPALGRGLGRGRPGRFQPLPRAPRSGAGRAWRWVRGLSRCRAGTAASAPAARPPPARGCRRGPPAAHPSAWPAPSG